MEQKNMKKILKSSALVIAVAALATGLTMSFFSDEEKSTGNTFAAGAIDLKIDSEAHYNGMVCSTEGVWEVEDENAVVVGYPVEGSRCALTWGQEDGKDIVGERFFNFADLKPGDMGENTISMHVLNNDAYMCAYIENMVDEENDVTEPEESLEDDNVAGELAQNLHFFAWADNGDNIYDPETESPLFDNIEGPASDVLDGRVYPMFTPDNGAFPGGETRFIGLAWCYGEFEVNGALTCDGAPVDNMSQTDSLTADIRFYVEQARHNEDFVCPPLEQEIVLETVETNNWSEVDLDGHVKWLAKFKVNEPDPASDFELQVGTNDTTLFAQNDTVWSDDRQETFTLTYDGTGSATLAVDGRPTTVYAVGEDTYERIGITLKAPADATTTIDNLNIDVGTLSTTTNASVTGGTNSLTISGADFSDGFILTGNFTFDWGVLTNNGENQKVQFSID